MASKSDEDITVNASTTTKRRRDDDSYSGEVFDLSVTSHGLTDVGAKRLHNEDAFYTSDEKCIWLVADGMGGHNAGDLASRSLVKNIEAFYKPGEDAEDTIEAIEEIVDQTNRALIDKAAEISRETVIGTTLALLATVENEGILLWAGDSRVYRIRSGLIEQLTQDHSLVNDMVNHGIINAEEAASHPDQNKITRAIGYDKALQLDYRKLSIQPGDRYIICSDGLTKELGDDEILAIANYGSTEPTNQELMKQALAAGATDNVTSITVDFFKGV